VILLDTTPFGVVKQVTKVEQKREDCLSREGLRIFNDGSDIYLHPVNMGLMGLLILLLLIYLSLLLWKVYILLYVKSLHDMSLIKLVGEQIFREEL